MKILAVSQYYWPERFQVTDECEDLVTRGHDVTVITGLPNYPSGEIDKEYRHGNNRVQEKNGVHIIRVPLVARGKNPLRLALNYHSFAWSASHKIKELPNSFDVVYVPEVSPVTMIKPAALYKKLHEVPLLVYCLDLWPESLKNILGSYGLPIINYYGRLSRHLYNAADCVAIQSPAFADYMTITHGIGSERLYYLPQFADDTYLEFDFDEDHHDINFLVMGNIGRAQDVPVILDAVNKMRHKSGFAVNFVGDGSLAKEMRKQTEKMGLTDRVKFYGKRPYEEMPDFYAVTDVCLLALNGDSWIGTTIPSRLQGYMAAGKPVFAAINGGAQFVINDSHCGQAVASGDSSGLAALMDMFLDDPSLFGHCGENARKYFKEKFTKKKHMDALESLLKRLCGKE